MARLPLHALPTFRTVARTANLRAAAETLHLTHSAVSQQIRLLETRLGTPLFDRHGRRIALNAAGLALLQAVEPALAQIDDGARAARAAAGVTAQTLRLTVVPSFAQRWLLPRMARWRATHPELALELHSSQLPADLVREGFDAALRQGTGPWKGLHAERLIDSPLIAVGPPELAARLRGRGTAALADEALLGDAALWARWFALEGLQPALRPVAVFNDAGLMLQAAEHGLGITLARDLLAADALRDGRLVRLSALALPDDTAQPIWLACPAARAGTPALQALADWLRAELAQSQRELDALSAPAAGTAPAGRTGSRSRAPSAARTASRAR